MQGAAAINEQKLTASDGTFGNEFGYSVAASGSTFVVGARADTIGANLRQGSAYVFNRQSGGFVETQKLTASDGSAFDNFGYSVAISGSTIVVGAISANSRHGAAYVFNRQGESWVETQKLTASDGATDDLFGWSVAISGSTVVVGAILGNPHGAAYVFNRQSGSWVETQKLIASARGAAEFGYSVAISGSTVVVGAIIDNFFVNSFQGSAFVFSHQGGSWVETQKLSPSNGGKFDLFGYSVAVSGSTIVVSARADTIGGNFDQGSAFVFNRQGGSWVETQQLIASDGEVGDEFGKSIAISGSTIVVGAQADIGGNSLQGAAYVFTSNGGSWVEEQKLTASDGKAFDNFGRSVAISGSTIIVGSPVDIGAPSFPGSAYVFEL